MAYGLSGAPTVGATGIGIERFIASQPWTDARLRGHDITDLRPSGTIGGASFVRALHGTELDEHALQLRVVLDCGLSVLVADA